MTDSRHAVDQVARLARVRDEDLTGIESGSAARALLAELVASEAPPHRPTPVRLPRARPARRLALAAAAVATITVAVVVGPALLESGPGSATSYANSAIEVRREGNFFVARIKDPLADRARYVEAFRAVGKDVDIELVPVSPARVGQLLEASSGGSGQAATDLVSSGSEPVDCALLPARCTMVVRISADTDGPVRYKLGRAARPGEAYQDPVVGTGATSTPGPANSGESAS